jgi:transglutaminase-like putative cysteine protease
VTSVGRQPTGLDFLIGAMSAGLAVVASAAGVNAGEIGAFFVVLIAFGTVLSFGLSRLGQGRRWLQLDALAYTAAALTAVVMIGPLNESLPGDGYPRQLLVAAVLSWMVGLGSLFAWRDQTLLFQAVPSIALFGLVGAWDTVAGSELYFFAFLLCVSTLFARAHARSMVRRAELAGEPDTRRLGEGPWRWMAGPEWALASAAIVVLLSFLGAPVLQQSVQGVTSAVRLTVPPGQRAQPAAIVSQRFGDSGSFESIGRGPNPVTDNPVMRVRMDRARYLRGRTYTNYTGRGWRAPTASQDEESVLRGAPVERPIEVYYDPFQVITSAKTIDFELKIDFGAHTSVYVPGEPWDVPVTRVPLRVMPDGTLRPQGDVRPGQSFPGSVVVPPEAFSARQAGVPPAGMGLASSFVDDRRIAPRVRRFAEDAARGAKTDYAKALAIKRAIERQVRYNINAAATPQEADPVDHFLFESREGYCDLFASAMTLGARAVGLPSRYVVGFYPTEGIRNREGYFVLRASDYHAWCEVFFEGVGWVAMDPTEGAEAIRGAGRGSVPSIGKPFYERTWFIWTVNVLIGTSVAAALALALLGLRRGSGERVAESDREEAAALYARFARDLERRTGRPRRLPNTPMEYVERLGDSLGPAYDPALALTQRFENALYAPSPPDETEIRDLSRAVRDFRRLPRDRR